MLPQNAAELQQSLQRAIRTQGVEGFPIAGLIGISDLSRNLPGTVERSIKQTTKPLIFVDGSVVSRNTNSLQSCIGIDDPSTFPFHALSARVNVKKKPDPFSEL